MKKKILSLCLVIALAAIALVGGTLAYFSDTEDQTNTFTAGKLTITLDEAVVEDEPDENGDLKATDDRTTDDQEYKLFPDMVVDKDPTITLDAGSEDAYIAAIVTVTADEVEGKTLYDLAGVDGYDTLDIYKLISGGLVAETSTSTTWNELFCFENSQCYIHQVADKANNTWIFYIFMKNAFKAGEDVALFENLNVSKEYNNEEMAVLNTMEIKVNAYGAQTVGFADCYDAMTKAFDEDFKFN